MNPFDRFAYWLYRWVRVLWVCRISLASVLVGLALMLLAPQAQDLFREAAPPLIGPMRDWPDGVRALLYWSSFLVLAFALWAVPVHYAARLLLQHDVGYFANGADYRHAFTWVPRLLGIACFVVLLVGEFKAWLNLPDCAGEATCVELRQPLSWFLWVLMAATAATGALFAYYVIRRRAGILKTAQTAPPVLPFFIASAVRNHGMPAPKPPPNLPELRRGRLIGLALLAVVTAVFVVVVAYDPAFVGRRLARSWLLVIVLGAWIPLLSLLAFASHWRRFPVILAVFVILAVVSVFDDRRYDARELAGAGGRITLGEAATLWHQHNPEAGARPLVVATAGGASRAAYHTGMVLAALRRAWPDIDRRLFAISGVSGGSVGAAFYAALARRGGDNPCDLPADEVAPGATPLQTCLARMLAGDFLSPVTVGFAFRDAINLPLGDDRASILERSWEQEYAALTDQDDAGDLADDFLAFAPTADRPWRPILLLNAASAATGKRIVVSPLAPRHGGRAVFRDAFDLHQLLRGETDGIARTVRLSTAAGLSARFPFITPAATLRDGDGNVVDRAVDGGYFENFGALTATELVSMLQLPDIGLRPVVLQISSDPEYDDSDPPPAPDAGDRLFLGGIRTVVGAFFAARVARGSHAAATQRDLMCGGDGGEKTAACDAYAHVRLQGKSAEVSMSWWLSEPVRHWIDRQFCADHNRDARATLVEALGPPTTPVCQ
ncbi:MAG: hypothetical protein RIM84_13685 [Alphaproteobacteria bacterium]